MLIGVTSDLHGDLSNAHNVCEALLSSDADVFILAGDASNGDVNELEAMLHIFKNFRGYKLFVAGNHDIYSVAGESSLEKYTHIIPEVCRRQSFRFLDQALLIKDKVAFIGNIGWYDASFRVREGNLQSRLFLQNGREIKNWGELQPDDYLHNKKFYYENDGEIRRTGWPDFRRVNLGISDRKFLDQSLSQLEKDLKDVDGVVDQVVTVTHMLPFENMVPRKPGNTKWSYFNAFMGSQRIGEVLLESKKVTTAISGHSHVLKYIRNGPIDCYSVGSNPSPLTQITI